MKRDFSGQSGQVGLERKKVSDLFQLNWIESSQYSSLAWNITWKEKAKVTLVRIQIYKYFLYLVQHQLSLCKVLPGYFPQNGQLNVNLT